ncbi:MAG: TldD/PmbA family protein [Candidatus Brocadiae bacterium]|nr:TldD/PmbA family protein [Candidatus Brocadiia bacterium]
MDASLQNALAQARADYAEIHLERRATTQIAYVGKELEDISQFSSVAGSVRALVKGGWGFVSFHSLDDLPHRVRMACEQAAMVGQTESHLAPVPPAVARVVQATVATDPRQVPLADKEALARRYNQRILAHDHVQTSSVRYRDAAVQSTFVSTEGAEVEQEAVFCGMAVAAIARDGANVQRAFKQVGDLRGYPICEGLDDECDRVVERAVALLAAEPVQGGHYTVIANPVLAGVFAHEAFGHLSEADFVYENPQLAEIMQLGKRFGPDPLSIVDDPTLDGMAGSYRYDSEGTPARPTALIKDGILTSRLHSRETAARMGEEPTGNARAITCEYPPIVRMSNTYIEPRDWEFGDLVADTGDGLYACGSIGGQTDMEMFTFSAEEAFLIKDGRIADRVREVVLTGNVFETLANIDAIGNDLEFLGGLGGCGKEGQFPLRVSTGAPHIRIRNCLVGGR